MKLLSAGGEIGSAVAVLSLRELRIIADSLATTRHHPASPAAQKEIAQSELAVQLAIAVLEGGHHSKEMHLIEYVYRMDLDPEILFQLIELDGHVERMRLAIRDWITGAETDEEIQLGHRLGQLADSYSPVAEPLAA